MKINQPIIFLRIAWMKHYQGVNENDIPSGAGSYVEENQNGGEVYNFSKKNGRYYGYARVQSGRNIDLSNLGAIKDSEELKNVTVVFFAKRPMYGGQYIVGWYKNAVLYRNLVKSPKKDKYDFGSCITECKISDGVLLGIDDRIFEVEGAGQTNIWYPDKHLNEKELAKIWKYLDYGKTTPHPKPRKKGGRGWQLDAELRKKIEVTAMDIVAEHFENLGFEIRDVHKENKGWDMEAIKGKRLFLLEIKGTQNEFNTIELTHNEYKQLNSNSKSFRLCVVSFVFTSRKLDVFFFNGSHWINESGQLLGFTELISARVAIK